MYTITDISKQMTSSRMSWWEAQAARVYMLSRGYCEGIPLQVVGA